MTYVVFQENWSLISDAGVDLGISVHGSELQQKTGGPKNVRILEESKRVSLKESFEVGSDDLMKEVKMMGNWLIQCLKS